MHTKRYNYRDIYNNDNDNDNDNNKLLDLEIKIEQMWGIKPQQYQ